MSENKENKAEILKYPRIILGLDVSTSCIGVCIAQDDGQSDKPEILSLTHVSPKVSSKIRGIEALFCKSKIFEDKVLASISGMGITDVVIEEPLFSSNNAMTVATLLRFNGMISESVYRILGVVPNFISSYDARTYSFPELVSVRKYNKKGLEYPITHIKKALKDGSCVLFGAYPFDIDKKMVMMNMVNEMYKNITWVYGNKGELRKENFDACDALVCVLAYVNINHHGIEPITISSSSIEEADDCYLIKYTSKIWDREYQKTLEIKKS